MNVQHISGTKLINTGSEPDTWTENIPTPVLSITNTAIMGENADSTGGGTAYPRGAIALELTADDTVTLTRSDNGQTQNYRFSVVEFPKEQIISQWNVIGITNDIWDPEILNTDEVAQISVQLPNQIFANGEVIVVISSENGVITSNAVTTT